MNNSDLIGVIFGILIIITVFVNFAIIVWFFRFAFKVNETQKKLDNIIYYLEKISNKKC